MRKEPIAVTLVTGEDRDMGRSLTHVPRFYIIYMLVKHPRGEDQRFLFGSAQFEMNETETLGF